MQPTLDFFFFVGSTYTYLTVNRIEEIAAREGITVRWRSFNVLTIMLEQNNRPFVGKPVKMAYMWRDVERRAQRYGIPFDFVPQYPVDPERLAGRIAVVGSIEGWCADYVKTCYRDWFLENQPPGDIDHTHKILARLGQNPDAVIARADSEQIRRRFDAETERARELGIFGSPTFRCGDEIFWGDDRLEDAIEWARNHPA